MRQIAILSLVFDNYGTRLQSYALCKALHRICGDEAHVEVVDVDTPWGKAMSISKKQLLLNAFKKYGIYGFPYIYRAFKWKYEYGIAQNRASVELEHKRSNLFKLLNGKIPYTSKHFTMDDIRMGALNDYDTLIVGSDQVWNGIRVPNQDVFLLDFAKQQKCLTYAASFGMSMMPPHISHIYENGLKKFSNMLIREDEGVEICKELGRKDAQRVLDPTLLLHYDDYSEIMDDAVPQIDGKYILVYSLNRSYGIYDETYKLCKRLGYKMVVLKRSFVPPINMEKYKGVVDLFAVSPGGFLSLIKNAECVLTNSFHALIFSINFNTPFYLYLDRAELENSRLITMAKLCRLESRIYWEMQSLPKSIEKIDYTESNKILSLERDKSITLLKESLGL